MLYSEVKRVFLSVQSVESRARAIKELDFGQIHVVSYTSLGTRVLPPILGTFMREHAGLRVSMSVRNSRVLLEAVAAQGFDLGFGLFAPDRPGVEFEKLCSMRAVCVLPPGHRLATRDFIHAKDLQGERFICMLDEDRAQLQIDQIFAKAGYERDIVTKVQLTESICSFAAAGVGVSIVDPFCTAGFSSEELVIKPFRPVIDFDIWVISPSFREPSLAAEALTAHVRQQLKAKLSAIGSAIGEEF
jgi:DNA-binding transcriptional LysR family regulator